MVWELRGSRWDYMGEAGGRAPWPMSGQLRLSSSSVVHWWWGDPSACTCVFSSVKR